MERKQIKSSEEEIDLLFYYGKFREGLDKAGEGLSHFLRVLWKNFILFFLIILVITAASYCVRYVIPPAYQTNALFVSRYLPANYYGLMTQDLNQLLDKKNVSIAAEQLNITPEMAAQIVAINLKPLRDTILERNDTVFAPFEVTLVIRDLNGLESVQDGLITYFEGGKNERKKKLEKKAALEATKQIFFEKMKNGDYQEYMQVERMLDGLDKIQVVQPFLKRFSYNYPNYNRYLLYGFLTSLILALILTPLVGRKI